MLLHNPDPDEIASSSPEVAAYDRQVMRLGSEAPEPTMQLFYGSDRGQRLDVYAPEGTESRPILLFFHGGAWVSGHLGWVRFMAPIVNAMGAVFVGGSYRLAPRCHWPAQYEDVDAALRFVAAQAERFGGDPDRIVIGGHSAGGHLSTLVALKGSGPRLLACMPVSSSFNLQYGDVPLESDAGRVYRYLFADRSQDHEASPLNFVDGADTPFHIVWGERDFERVRDSSQAMTAALRSAGKEVTHRVVPYASHFDTHLALSDRRDPWYDRLSAAFARSRVRP